MPEQITEDARPGKRIRDDVLKYYIARKEDPVLMEERRIDTIKTFKVGAEIMKPFLKSLTPLQFGKFKEAVQEKTMLAYFVFRFCLDFIKPIHPIFLGLSSIQITCVGVIFYYIFKLSQLKSN